MTLKKKDGRTQQPLTEKQRKFAKLYIQNGGEATKAYREAYDKHDQSPQVARTKGYDLKNNERIKEEIARLHKLADREHIVTLRQLTEELDENRNLARQLGKPEAMNAAVLGKAKLHGLITDKRETKHTMADEFVEKLLTDLPNTMGLPSEHEKYPDEERDDEVVH